MVAEKLILRGTIIVAKLLLLISPCLFSASVLAQDSTSVLLKVTVRSSHRQNVFKRNMPAQIISAEVLQKINAPSVGDIARFFSGVQVKDYGGAGGLKTISVRSLGGSNTGILYDGIPVTDAQSGQVDLGRFAGNFLQSVELLQANAAGTLLPAKAFASASILSITSINSALNFTTKKNNWQAGIRKGSFNYNQAFAGLNILLPGNYSVGANAVVVQADGDYPFVLQNGNLTEKAIRNNSAIRSLQAEISASKTFKDSAVLQLKTWAYTSKRGLPNALVFFNTRSKQQLWNADYFLQASYRKKVAAATSVLFSGKFNHSYTRYTDPDFLNNSGGLNDQYDQNESYFSAAIDHKIWRFFTASLSSDIAYNTLRANKNNFAFPSRISTWNNGMLGFFDSLWQVNASVLWSRFQDETKVGIAATTENKFTPTLAVSRKLKTNSPILIRAFYKETFRMPSFNDLYYNFIGNSKLRPEYARQVNLGVVFTKKFTRAVKEFNLSADAYSNKIKDKIIAVPGQNLFAFTILNLGEVHIKGVDVTAEGSGKLPSDISWFGRLAYTWQRAQDFTDAQSTVYKDRIPYSPDHSGSAIATLSYKKYEAGYTATFSGTRYSLGDNNAFNELDGWAVHDVFVQRGVAFPKFNMQVKAELNNISNQQYDVIRFYPMPGRSVKISLLFNHL